MSIMAMKKSVLPATAARLKETPEGCALLELIEQHGNPMRLSQALGIDAQPIRQWIYNGRASKTGARLIENTLGVPKEKVRPDIPVDDWVKKEPEPKPVRVPVARNEDAKLLVALAEKYGSVRALCELAFCTPGDYHTWKTRGRIPAIKLPTFMALRK
jgi:DNA-binding transcriptional regulator YdaS (Cro superfamily)